MSGEAGADLVGGGQAYNHTPRQCLDFQTPAEVFSRVLHFERESTSRLSPGRAGGNYTRRNTRKLFTAATSS